MAEQAKLNRGVLFTNKKKETEKHPDYTGIFVDSEGNEFWVSSWINESKAGEKYMSFPTQPKDSPAPAAKTTIKKADNDDLPF